MLVDEKLRQSASFPLDFFDLEEMVSFHGFQVVSGSGGTAVIKAVHPKDVRRIHLGGPTNGHIFIRNGNDGWLSVPGEGIPSIVHDRVVVVGSAKIPCIDLVKIVFLPRSDILPYDANMFVSVGPGLLMVEAQGVEQLMLDDPQENTAPAHQRHYLASTTTPNI